MHSVRSFDLGKFHHELTVHRTLELWFILGKSSPFMAELFKLVKHYDLPSSVSSNVAAANPLEMRLSIEKST